MTTADWLRRAADVWDEADAAQGPEARQAKVNLAEEYERLAKHAAYLAHHDCCLAGDDQIAPAVTEKHVRCWVFFQP